MENIKLTGKTLVDDKNNTCSLCSMIIEAGTSHSVDAFPDKKWETYETFHTHKKCRQLWAHLQFNKSVVFELNDFDAKTKFLAAVRDRLYEYFDSNYISAHMESGVFDGGISAEIDLVIQKILGPSKGKILKQLFVKGNNRRLWIVFWEYENGVNVQISAKRLVDFKTKIISEYELLLTIESFILLASNLDFLMQNTEIQKLISKEVQEMGIRKDYKRFTDF